MKKRNNNRWKKRIHFNLYKEETKDTKKSIKYSESKDKKKK